MIAAPSSSQGDQSKLGGPDESLLERSPGIGREERHPISVVVQSLNRFCYLSDFVFSNCEWLDDMIVNTKWFIYESVLVYQ